MGDCFKMEGYPEWADQYTEPLEDFGLEDWNPNQEFRSEYPDYYLAEGYDIMEVITAFDMDFPSSCAAKYLFRAGRKPGMKRIVDLRKAQLCLERAVQRELIFACDVPRDAVY